MNYWALQKSRISYLDWISHLSSGPSKLPSFEYNLSVMMMMMMTMMMMMMMMMTMMMMMMMMMMMTMLMIKCISEN